MSSMLDFDEARTGVHVRKDRLLLPDEMPFEAWRELGSRVALIANCSAWWLGDWLLYGEQNYGARYEQAVADTSLSYQTLRNYAWVARTFPVSRRRDTLRFGHHVEVAALPEDEQDIWLARAEQLAWSCNKLRRALRAAKLANQRASIDDGTTQIRVVKIDVPAERHDRWRSAAAQQHRSVADWVIETLDHVASEELSTRDNMAR
ncbi:MAG: LmbU family transcriptional regulator [Pseudonocardiaceae bacterium]